MEEIDFSNEELKNIEPTSLIKDSDKDDIATFFLVLAVVYNDLKSLFFYVLETKNQFKDLGINDDKPKEPSALLGEYVGMKIHAERVIIGTVYEFLEFIKKPKRITKK